MFIAALILVMSLAVVVQFSLLSWHAGLIRVADEPASNAGAGANALIPDGFANVAAYGKLCPDFGNGSYLRLPTVRLYYRAMELVRDLTQAPWAYREMSLCTRYAAVTLSHRLERNQAMLAAVRSF